MVRMMTQLPHRGVLEIQGEDKATFLQGLITNDTTKITSESAIYATLLNPQGRFLYDFFIVEKNGSYFLDAEANRLETLLKKLSLYKLRSDINFTIRSDLKVFAIWMKNGRELLDVKKEKGNSNGIFFTDPRLLELGARVIGEVMEKDLQPATPQDYDLHRLILGIPEGGRDLIPEKAILLESGLDELNAISWTKGCYMGQELTARTKYRGLVRKRLFPVTIEGTPPAERTEIFLNGDSVGEMRSQVDSHGLALLRLEAFKAYEEGIGELMCEKSRLKPYVPVWMRLEDPS